MELYKMVDDIYYTVKEKFKQMFPKQKVELVLVYTLDPGVILYLNDRSTEIMYDLDKRLPNWLDQNWETTRAFITDQMRELYGY